MCSDKVRKLSVGANPSGVRAYNERLLLSTLQRHGAMPGSEVARRTGLSSQTASVILRKLESDGLVLRGESVRGKVGKPFTPMAVNPLGLFSYGLKIGRRSAELLLMDFSGRIREQLHLTYPYPMPQDVFGFLREGMAQIESGLTPAEVTRICGIGIGTPFDLWSWHEQIGAPSHEFQIWKDVSFESEVVHFSDLPVFVVNDATAACRAEQTYGRGKEFRDYVYFFVGSFVGGGIVLNHSVYEGARGNAGALAPLPCRRPDGSAGQLLDFASIHVLENTLQTADIDTRQLWGQPQDWSALTEFVDPWLEQAAEALASASVTTCAVIDFEAVLIDGAMPSNVRADLVARTRSKLTQMDTRGVISPAIEEGLIGANARAIGAASSPFISQYLLDTNASFADIAS